MEPLNLNRKANRKPALSVYHSGWTGENCRDKTASRDWTGHFITASISLHNSAISSVVIPPHQYRRMGQGANETALLKL